MGNLLIRLPVRGQRLTGTGTETKGAVFLALALTFAGLATCPAAGKPSLALPAGDGPLEVSLTLHIFKIDDVDTVSESYNVEGYLLSEWRDPRVAELFADEDGDQLRFEDQQARKVMGPGVWHPDFEFINTVGSRLVTNRLLKVSKNGRVAYDERFNGKFSSDMDFRKYPFDHQTFTIEIESYSHSSEELVFVDPREPELHGAATSLDEWDLTEWASAVTSVEALEVDESFTRYTLSIGASRQSGFYIWRVLLPLLLIIAASWFVFWMAEFGNQIATAMTLMLTVVAFNFYVSNSLPRVPYNTYIDLVIMSGYVAIFMAILVVVAKHATTERKGGELTAKVFSACRWAFPFAYVVAMLFLTALFLG